MDNIEKCVSKFRDVLYKGQEDIERILKAHGKLEADEKVALILNGNELRQLSKNERFATSYTTYRVENG